MDLMDRVINADDALHTPGVVFIDTRSPDEFRHDHIPGSVNIPILSNEERKAVGILYKKDQKRAYRLAFSYYEKKLKRLTDEISRIDRKSRVVVYCWRGGLRSATITGLVSGLGYDACQLKGGYKAYREFIRRYFDSLFPDVVFIVLYGLAGSGKTELIQSLENSIDLEGLAQHRSSIFGAIGLSPRSQKMFESLLYSRIEELKRCSHVFIEGESRKVGNVYIPNSVYSRMGKGIAVRVRCSLRSRAERVVRDYFSHGEDARIKGLIRSLRQALTNKVVDELLRQVDGKEYHGVAEKLLELYYDPRYEHQMRDVKFDYEVDSESIDKAAGILSDFRERLAKESAHKNNT